MDLASLLAMGGLSPVESGVLTACAFLTAGMTAALGVGGGVVMLGAMAFVLPGPAVIPLHGIVQLASNAGRAGVLGRYARWDIVLWFVLGSLAGVALGGRVAVALPDAALKLVLAVFILYAVWGPMPRFDRGGPMTKIAGGALASFLTMFVGATGPFVMAVLAPGTRDRRRLVATHAVTMTVQHGLKVAVFGLLGFAFAPWIGLLAIMVGAGFVGTLAGTRLLERTSNDRFHRAFRVTMTGLALLLAARALLSLRG